MHILLENLLKQHFDGIENVPPAMLPFLQDLNNSLESHQNGQLLQTILDSMPFGITIIDYQKKILHANRSALDLMGYESQEEIRGHICHDTLCPAAEGQCPILDLDLDVDKSERFLFTRDKKTIPILKSVTPIIFDGQEVLLEAFVDVSERNKLIDEKQKAYKKRGELADSINTILKSLADQEDDSNLYQNITDLVQTLLGFERVQFFTFNPAGKNLRMVSISGDQDKIPPAQHSILPLKTGAVGKAAADRETKIASDLDLDLFQFPQMLMDGTQSQAALPVIIGGDVAGVLDVQSSQSNVFDQDTLLFLDILSQQISHFIENIRSRMEMLDQINELAVLQKMTSAQGWQSFRDLANLSSNRYLFDANLQTAVPVEDDFTSADDRDQNALRKSLEVRGEVIGSLGITSTPDEPLTPEEQQLLDAISSEVAEALERARLFETSQRSASELAILNEMGASFAQSLNEETITDTIYNYTSKLMETPQFYVALYDETEQVISFPYVVMDGVKVTEEHEYFDQWQPRSVGSGLTGYIIEKKVPILIDENAEKSLKELGLPYTQFGGETQSWLGVPMVIGDRVLGVISVQCETEANLYNRHHLDLLTTIASQASVAINNTRLFNIEQERAEQERTVRTITDRVRRGTSTQEILQIALEELSQVLNADISTIKLGQQEELIQPEDEEIDSDDRDDIVEIR